MLKILGNMKKYWKSIIIIIVLLFVQAVCDLKLPDYTSSLIDVGIQNSGIEYSTPKQLTPESYSRVSLFMTNDEASLWESSYTLGSDGFYHLNDNSEKSLDEKDDVFTTPIAISYMFSQMDLSKVDSSQTGGMDLSALSKLDLSKMSPEQLMQLKGVFQNIRSTMDKQLSAMGSSIIHSSAVAFTKAEYESTGVNLDSMQTSYLWNTGIKMILMALLMAIAAIGVGFLASKVGAGIGRDLREKVFTSVVGFSSREIDTFSTASLITRSTNDIQQVQMISTILLRLVFYAPILAIGGIIMVVRTGAGMGWVIFVGVAAISCVVVALVSVAMPKFKLMQTLVDKVNLVSREILTGLSVIRAFGREKEEEKRFDDANTSLTKTMLFTSRVMTFMMPGMMLIMNGLTLLIVWVAAHRIDQGSLQVGAMTAFITYTIMIVSSFLMLTMVSIFLPRAAVAAGRINQVLETVPTIHDPENPEKLDGCKGVVAFNHVSFKYPGAEADTLEDIDFTAKPGETTAIIGSTGCGKSTLVQLIPRFYDVTEGSITLDGVDIRNLSQHDLRDKIGFVPQKGVLFSGTISSNIRFGAPGISDDQVTEAAEIAQATEFIDEKPEKYESSIAQGGGNVSGGQKQRLSIARAIAKSPKIYIFDDSFSALDFKTDVTLRRALSEKIVGSTLIIVAQRISTVLHADQIIVLDDGHIAGKGNHSELMDTCEVYRQIAMSQLSEKELESSFSRKEEA
jgi:ATP-binding cassette subfamily B protein